MVRDLHECAVPVVPIHTNAYNSYIHSNSRDAILTRRTLTSAHTPFPRHILSWTFSGHYATKRDVDCLVKMVPLSCHTKGHGDKLCVM
jgi:hypothetical protein